MVDFESFATLSRVQCHPERSEPASEVEGSATRGVERFGSRILRKLSRCEPANSRDNCHPERRIRSFKCSGCASARRKLRMTFKLCRTRTYGTLYLAAAAIGGVGAGSGDLPGRSRQSATPADLGRPAAGPSFHPQ